jgi:hypothetical protein
MADTILYFHIPTAHVFISRYAEFRLKRTGQATSAWEREHREGRSPTSVLVLDNLQPLSGKEAQLISDSFQFIIATAKLENGGDLETALKLPRTSYFSSSLRAPRI